jgi:multiple sugar transport system substrate-binding protein
MAAAMSRRELIRRSVMLSGAAAAAPALLPGLLDSASASSRMDAGEARWSSAAAAGKPKSLNMLYATVEADSDAIKLVLPAFKKEFGFGINLDTIPYNALQQKTFSELASRSSHYDIMIVDTPWMPALTKKVEPLSALIRKEKSSDLQLTDFIDKVFYDTAVYSAKNPHAHYPKVNPKIDLGAITGSGFDVFGLPIQANVLTLSYRKDLFDDPSEKAAFKAKYGAELAPPATWDDFSKVAEFFTRPDKRLYGTTLMAGVGDWSVDDFKTLLASFGGDGHMVGDKFQFAFDTPQAVAALQFYQDMIQKQKIVPPGTTAASWDNASSYFGSGLTAMSMNYHTETLSGNVKGEIAYALVPKKVAHGPHFGTWMLSLNHFGKNKPWSFRALVWLTAAAQQRRMLATQLHPTRKSVYASAAGNASLAKFGNFYDILGQSLKYGVGRPRLTNYGDVSHTISVAVNQAANGSDPAGQLSGAATQVKSQLQQAGYKV